MANTQKTHIKNHLVWDNRVSAAYIDVNVTDSIARLSGTVPTYYEKMIAAEDALTIPGIELVENNLKVAFSKEQKVQSDNELKDSIEKILEWDTRIDSRNIDVLVKTGIVTLDGSVDAYWKKYEVEDIAFRMSGVVDVTNNLHVVSEISYEDHEIAKGIRDAINRSLVDPEKVSIDVSNGTVTLGGTAISNTQKRIARDKAAFTAGVTDVKNEIKVAK